jgi:hypothetical protein
LEQYLGMVTFAVALGCLFVFGRWLQGKAPVQEPACPTATPKPAGPWLRDWPAAAVAVSLMAATALFLGRVAAGHHLGTPGLKLVDGAKSIVAGSPDRIQAVLLPPEVGEFSSEPMEIAPIELSWLPSDTLFGRRKYISTKDHFWAQLSVVLMGTDRTSIHKPQYCLEGQGWRIEKSETLTVPLAKPYPYDLQVMLLTSSGGVMDHGVFQPARAIYAYWFVADHELTPYHGKRMWWMARDLIRSGVLQRWAYVSYFTMCRPGYEEPTVARLKDLIAASVPEFQLAAGERRTTESKVATSTKDARGSKN